MSFSDMFSRSMTADGVKPAGTLRPHKMKAMLVVIAAVLATVAAVGGTTLLPEPPGSSADRGRASLQR